MAAIQLNFTLRTSSNCKTVHLLGSWDNYAGQLPLSKDPKKSGGWVGAFKFQGSMLKQGQRYWYYYIIDGYHVSHDPAREHTTEPTTGRKLNILDIPGKTKTSSSGSSRDQRSAQRSNRDSKRYSSASTASIPKGRAISPERIAAPRPQRPHQTREVINTQYDKATLDQLTSRFARTTVSPGSSDDSDEDSYIDSDDDSDVPSLTSRSTNSSSPSSVSSGSSCCTCERYGITRSGDRVKLDCGGARCGYSDDSSECSSEDEYIHEYEPKTTRRQGLVIRT